MLKIIPDDFQVIRKEWIKYYDKLPEPPRYRGTSWAYVVHGVDLAISLKDSADYTAIVSAIVYDHMEKLKIYILPRPVNERLTSLQTLSRIKAIYKAHYASWGNYVMVEDVGYQGSLVEQLRKEGVPAEGVKVFGQDKRSRLASVSHLIESDKVFFPSDGSCQELITELLGLGIENHDDLVDALSLLLSQVIELDHPLPEVVMLG